MARNTIAVRNYW